MDFCALVIRWSIIDSNALNNALVIAPYDTSITSAAHEHLWQLPQLSYGFQHDSSPAPSEYKP